MLMIDKSWWRYAPKTWEFPDKLLFVEKEASKPLLCITFITVWAFPYNLCAGHYHPLLCEQYHPSIFSRPKSPFSYQICKFNKWLKTWSCDFKITFICAASRVINIQDNNCFVEIKKKKEEILLAIHRYFLKYSFYPFLLKYRSSRILITLKAVLVKVTWFDELKELQEFLKSFVKFTDLV